MLFAGWCEAAKIYHRTKPQPARLLQCFPPGILNYSLHFLKQEVLQLKEHTTVLWALSTSKKYTETRAEFETHQSTHAQNQAGSSGHSFKPHSSAAS